MAVGAEDFGSFHKKAVVGFFGDGVLLCGFCEARPAGARVEFVRRGEQRGVAAHACVEPVFFMVVVLSGEGALGSFLLGDAELLWGESLAPIVGGEVLGFLAAEALGVRLGCCRRGRGFFGFFHHGSLLFSVGGGVLRG